MANAVADTSFLIDWARYSKSKLLFKLFDVIFIAESVLKEVVSERTLVWVAEGLEEGRLAVLPEIPDLMVEALDLVARSRRAPLRSVDYPEALCLILGKRFGYVVLTENGGALAFASYDPSYSNVKVMRALEVLYELWKLGYITSFLQELDLYRLDTRRVYSRRDLRRLGVEA